MKILAGEGLGKRCTEVQAQDDVGFGRMIGLPSKQEFGRYFDWRIERLFTITVLAVGRGSVCACTEKDLKRLYFQRREHNRRIGAFCALTKIRKNNDGDVLVHKLLTSIFTIST